MSTAFLSIIIPVYNEEGNVESAYQSVSAELARIPSIDYELIFTDNHSEDATFEKLKRIAAADHRVRVLRFARNFGFHRSILTGYRYARGDAAIQIDADLEDPPSVIPLFIERWRAGHDVVVGIRAQRAESPLMSLLRTHFYRFLNRISDSPHAVDAGDFRLVDRSILDQLRTINDSRPYVRGLISELARSQVGIPYSRQRRASGESKFPIRQLVKLGAEAIFESSTLPLRVATYAGIGIAIVTLSLSGIYLLGRVMSGPEWPAGFATNVVLILFGIALNALFLGVIGEYVGRIYEQLRQRPTVIIEQTLNIEDASPPSRKSDGLQRN